MSFVTRWATQHQHNVLERGEGVNYVFCHQEVPPLESALEPGNWRGGKQPGRWSPGGKEELWWDLSNFINIKILISSIFAFSGT